MKMLLLKVRVSDTYSYDGTTAENVGVFSSFETIRQMLFAEHAGEIVNHELPRGYNGASFQVKYYNGATLSSYPVDKYEYDEIELDKKI